ncbi:MAG: GIY-YIG nuclease family protein [Gammaproteobacteria bacterium]|nr:GIY-YIG nuclease family protein [Gammaproteobacteria bacterium]
MCDIPVSNLINIDEPNNFKLHTARCNGEVEPLDVFVSDKDEWINWNRWRRGRSEFKRRYIFSLINFYPETETGIWLFGGIYEVLRDNKIPYSHSYEIKELDEYSVYVGRLKVRLENVPRGRAFYLEDYIENMSISEILKQPYSGEAFPGYENINHEFRKLTPIFENENSDWKTALESVKGVYVVTDRNNGRKYVGSAYGDSGIWSRWSCYLGTGHGWNDELMKLIEKEGPQYAMQNFVLSLLEYRPMKTDDKVLIERETYWKEVFLSRGEFGYNKN